MRNDTIEDSRKYDTCLTMAKPTYKLFLYNPFCRHLVCYIPALHVYFFFISIPSHMSANRFSYFIRMVAGHTDESDRQD